MYAWIYGCEQLNMIIRFLNFDHNVHRHLHHHNAPNAVSATSLTIPLSLLRYLNKSAATISIVA
jgi:hypothetical protein